MRTLKILENSKQFWFVIFIVLFFFLLRLPSLFEPLWYGDEGIYQVIGTSLNHGKLLYKEVFDNKPPLLYWLYSFLHSDQFAIRLASIMFGVLAIILFFFLSKKIFENRKNLALLTTFIFAILFGLPLFEGNIANAENFMLLPIIGAAFLITNKKKFILAGLLLGIAFLFKIVAIFDMSAFIVFLLITNIASLKKELKIFPLIAGFLLPILLVVSLFIFNGTFLDFIKAAFANNISYVSYGNSIRNVPILLFAKLILLVGFILFTFMKRKNFDSTGLFILIWFAFSLFNAFFSQRPYTHYLLVLIPSFSLMIGLLFYRKYQKILVVILLLSLLVIAKEFGVLRLKGNLNYYHNFLTYVLDKKSAKSYQASFDSRTPFDYEIARFIKPKLNNNDTIFIWGNNAQLYQLVNVVAPTKYVVSYHILGYKDGITSTQKALNKIKPKFIVVMSGNQSIPFSLINYSAKININNSSIYERSF